MRRRGAQLRDVAHAHRPIDCGRWILWVVTLVVAAELPVDCRQQREFRAGRSSRSGSRPNPILRGLSVTLGLTVVAMLIGIVIGLLLADRAPVRHDRCSAALPASYIWFFRGTPLLVQLIFWYNLSTLFPAISIGDPVRPDAGQLEHQRSHHADDGGDRRAVR